MAGVADGMACGRLNHLNAVSDGVCAVGYASCFGVGWVGVKVRGLIWAIFRPLC
jgi:hypothetical protein